MTKGARFITEAYTLTIMNGERCEGVTMVERASQIAKELARYMNGRPLEYALVNHWQCHTHADRFPQWTHVEAYRWPA